MKKVESPIIFDNLKNAVKGGLYDPAFGPMDAKEKCSTCGLNHFECPGHFGHIEVSVPLYNPLVFMCVMVYIYIWNRGISKTSVVLLVQDTIQNHAISLSPLL